LAAPVSAADTPVAVERRIRLRDGVSLHALHWEGHDPQATPFLLVHGLASNARLWAPVADRLAAAGHPVVALDQRSHGRSDPSDRLDMLTLADDLAEVTDRLGLDRPVAAGQSWGAHVVIEFGVRHPMQTRGVVGVDGGVIDLARRFATFEDCWEALEPPDFSGTPSTVIEAHLRERLRGWPVGAVDAQLANFHIEHDGAARAILTRPRHRSIVEAMFQDRPFERIERLPVPLLLLPVTGGQRPVVVEEALVEVERMARARDATAAITVMRLPSDEHDVHLQQPEVVAAAVTDWATRVTSEQVH